MIPSIERLLQHITEFPVLGQFVISAICAALTEEWSTVAVFGLARVGKVGWGMAIGSVFVGTTLLNIALWYAGRVAGARALQWKMFSSLQRGRMEALRHHVQREGWIAVAVARFVPGTRVPIFVLTGILGMEARTYILTMVGSTLLWMVTTLGLLHLGVELASHNPLLLVVGIIALGSGLYAFVRWRSRRLTGR